MKRTITISLLGNRPPKEKKFLGPEEIMVYAKGAGLYSYLNVISKYAASRSFDRTPFEVRQ